MALMEAHGYKFLDAHHEAVYVEAKALLDAEDARQGHEARRLLLEWEGLPEREYARRFAEHRRYMLACREPYVKILVDILSLASPVMLVPIAYEQTAK
jgi:hypothetical protein